MRYVFLEEDLSIRINVRISHVESSQLSPTRNCQRQGHKRPWPEILRRLSCWSILHCRSRGDFWNGRLCDCDLWLGRWDFCVKWCEVMPSEKDWARSWWEGFCHSTNLIIICNCSAAVKTCVFLFLIIIFSSWRALLDTPPSILQTPLLHFQRPHLLRKPISWSISSYRNVGCQ